MENFWAGTCAPREGESPETGVPVHKETPSHVGPRGSCNVFEKPGKAGTWRAVNRESCTSQPVNSSWTVAPNRCGLREPRVAWHTNPASAHNPCST